MQHQKPNFGGASLPQEPPQTNANFQGSFGLEVGFDGKWQAWWVLRIQRGERSLS